MSFSVVFTILGWALIIGLGLYLFYVISMRSQRHTTRVSILVVLILLIGVSILLPFLPGFRGH